MIVIRNPNKWQGNTPTDCDYRVTKSQSIVKTLVNRELGHFASKGKQFDFIPTIYYTIFKDNSPRYQVIDGSVLSGNFKVMEWTFHPNYRNGC